MPDFVRACHEAAQAGGQVLLDWLDKFEVREKGPSDLVTQADCVSNEAIRGVLHRAFPDHGWVSEEAEAVNAKAEYCWVVDPLDGTTNYVHRLPHYAVSIALLHRNKPVVGVILDPVHNECFAAERGSGATLNSQPIRTSDAVELSQALVAASFSAKVAAGSAEIDQFVAALLHCQAVRRTGSAALNLAYVAAGRFDCFWAMSTKIWDVAAGVLVVEEAGGVVSAVDGSAFDLAKPHPVVSATPKLQAQFQRLLAGAVSTA